MEQKRHYCNQKQKSTLVDIIKNEKQLLSGKFSSTFTYKDAQKKWEEIGVALNAIPGGGSKDWKQWRKTWQDLRSKTKNKKASIHKYRNGTGGGPSNKEMITPTEETILSVISPYGIVGNEAIAESSLEFKFDEDDTAAASTSKPNGTNDTLVLNNLKEVKNTENMKSTNNSLYKNESQKKTKRTVAGKRLMETANATSILADSSKKQIEIQQEYYSKKTLYYLKD